VAFHGSGFMAASSDGPSERVGAASAGFDDQDVEQVAKFVDGHSDQPGWVVTVAVTGGRGGEEGVGEDRQGGPAVPGRPAAVLVLVQTEAGLRGLERFLDFPAASGDRDEGVQGGGFG
jgi:hypothetical protein